MSVYIDKIGHLAADSLGELHAFADRAGLRREWFQERGELSHYDCTTSAMRGRVQTLGAVIVTVREMPAIIRRMNTWQP